MHKHVHASVHRYVHTHGSIQIYMFYTYIRVRVLIPVVPHTAAAEFSNMGNLYEGLVAVNRQPLSISLSICLSTCLSICLSIHLPPTCLSTHLSVYPAVF